MKSAQQFCARSAHCLVPRGRPQAAYKLSSTPTSINRGRCSWWRNGSRASNSNATSILPSLIQSSQRSNFQARRRWFALTQLNGRKGWTRWRFIESPQGPLAIDLKSQTSCENCSQEREDNAQDIDFGRDECRDDDGRFGRPASKCSERIHGDRPVLIKQRRAVT